MHRDTKLKPRRQGSLPQEKLLGILKGIYPENIAEDLYENLTESKGNKNSKEGFEVGSK